MGTVHYASKRLGQRCIECATCLVERGVVVARLLAADLGRNDRRDPGCLEPVDDALIGVIGLVCDEEGGLNRVD